MTRGPMMGWRTIAGSLLALAAVAGCSSGDDTATTSTTQASAAQPAAIADTEATFEIPPERFEEVQAAGLAYDEVDYPDQPDDVPWPTDEWATVDLPEGVDAEQIGAIVDRAFGELSADGETIDAILIVKDGQLVLEEYNGWDPDATHMSWSVAKSINSALIGILVGQGELDIWEPVDAPEWQEPGDPRAEITLDHLLRMSSGLEWSEDYVDPTGDVISTLGGDADRAGYAASKPLEDPPGSTWYYSSGTANLIGRSVAEQVGYGDDLTDWIDQELFEPLGIDQVEHSLDATGLHSAGSWINLTPQDFARFGLLYARGGIWEDRRILPEGWVDYSRMPTPSEPGGNYGAQWWLEPERPGLFYASGFEGQSVNVAPAEDLVIVVLSNAGDGRDEEIRSALFDAFGL